MHAEFAMSFSPLLCSLLPISLSLSLSFSLSPLLFSFSLPLCMILSHNSTMTIMLQPRHVMQCRRVCFALPCYEMPCPWFLSLRCGLCACYSHYSSRFFFLYSHNMWFPIFPGSVFFSCSSRYAKLCHGIAMQLSSCYCCRWSSLCMVCAMLYLSVPGGLHVITRPVHLPLRAFSWMGLLFTVVSHTRSQRVSLGCDRHRGFVLCQEAHSKGHVARWAARRGH